jgi:hypothetical protein
MNARPCESLAIESIREDGQKFRPSDWIERMSATMASFGPDHRLKYNHSLHPGVLDGTKCLVMSKLLEQENPPLYDHIMKFARSNTLRIRDYYEPESE